MCANHRLKANIRAITILLSGCLGFTLGGCTYASLELDNGPERTFPEINAVPEIQALLPERIRETGRLSIASELTYPPMEYVGADGRTAIGLDIDIAEAVAAVFGLEPVVQAASFDSIIPGLGARYDLGVSAFTITPERLAAVNMVSYLSAGSQLAVAAGNPLVIDPDYLCGVKIAVQTGTTQHQELQDLNTLECRLDPIVIYPFDSQGDATANLIGGRVEAMYADSPITAYAVERAEGVLMELGDIIDAAPYGFVISESDAELAGAVQVALQYLINTGMLAQIAHAWGSEDALITTAQLNPEN
ncbi:MAG: ABC transporter substrate-binding protein [Promicromonosporaceae bacterium]|nr:ABC transporter substrate-binding protein [Promicromonosporaceae bacterium]